MFKLYGLLQNPVPNEPMQRTVGSYVYLTTKQTLKIMGEADKIKQASAVFNIDEEVHIACGTRLAASGGAEYAHVPCSVLCGNAKNFVALGFQQLVNGHCSTLWVTETKKHRGALQALPVLPKWRVNIKTVDS